MILRIFRKMIFVLSLMTMLLFVAGLMPLSAQNAVGGGITVSGRVVDEDRVDAALKCVLADIFEEAVSDDSHEGNIIHKS